MKSIRIAGLTLVLAASLALAACMPAASPLQVGLPAAVRVALATVLPGATAGSTAGPQGTAATVAPADTAAPGILAPTSTPAPATTAGGAPLPNVGDLQATLEQIYDANNASVVNIQVTGPMTQTFVPQMPQMPNMPGTPSPRGPGGTLPLPMQALGSGFVWDAQGHIVTNNHVVDGATQISVTFADGVTVPAKLVGRDPDSDLAVVQVNPQGLTLQPVTAADSTQARPGEFVVAIGNPFGLEGSMSFGIISALGRSLPTQSTTGFNQPTFTIPDIIQTDAPINPGNSGGVLLDLQGHLVGVPTAIESVLRANSGVGFAIPSAIVQNVVPVLIQGGQVQHPYLGISGTTLGPDLAQAMGLDPGQRGALVIDVTKGGPAEQAGVHGSNREVTINGLQAPVGGDIIVKIGNQPVTRFDDLPSYLARSTKVGQTVPLTVLRNGQQMTLNVTLGNRPAQASSAAAATPQATAEATSPAVQATPQATSPAMQATPQATSPAVQTTPQAASPTPPLSLGQATVQATPEPMGQGTAQAPAGPTTQAMPQGTAQATPQVSQGTVWLGVSVLSVTPEIAQAMNLPADQSGVLVESVAANSPADQAGLRGGNQSFTPSRGQPVQIGGDVIVAFDGQDVGTAQDLVRMVQRAQPGQQVTLGILRGGSQLDVKVTLATRPAGS